MVLSSLFFIFTFLPLTLGIFLLLPKPYRYYWLVATSLFFYTWEEPVHIFLLVATIIANYCFGLLINHGHKNENIWAKIGVITSIIFNIGLLSIFKYLNFITKNIHTMFGDIITVTNIILPVGISFFTFSALSYTIDVYRKTIKVEKNPLNVALFIALFPKLTTGPIIKYIAIKKSLDQTKTTSSSLAQGIKRFIQGLSKKVILADAFKVIADQAFLLTGTSELSVSLAWLGALAYTFQIYFDFSGYSDMAIGISKMIGFSFPENFNYPYIAKSATEFWRRWHITLGTWFRDYLYFPLGGSHVGKLRIVVNLLVVWITTGIWHGASWSFVAWGLLYFVLISFEKLSNWPKKLKKKSSKALYQVFILSSIFFGWILFRANGLIPAYKYILSLFGIANNPLIDDLTILYIHENWAFFVTAILFSFPFFTQLNKKHQITKKWGRRGSIISIMWYVFLFLLSISYLVVNGHNPAVYFNF